MDEETFEEQSIDSEEISDEESIEENNSDLDEDNKSNESEESLKEEESIILNQDIYDIDLFNKEYNVSNNVFTQNTLTKYEKTTVIGMRAEQIAQGSSPFLSDEELKDITDIMDIVNKEFDLKRIPFIIKRPISNNTYEYWKLSDLN